MRVTRSTKRALLVVGVAAGLFAVTAAGLGFWQRHQRQRLAAVVARLEAGLEALERQHRPTAPIDDEANAGPALLAAARDISDTCRQAFGDVSRLLTRPVAGWSRDDARRVAASATVCAPSLEALRAAADRPHVRFPSVIVTEAAENRGRQSGLVALLRAARLLALDTREAAASRAPQRQAADLNALAKIGTGLAREDSFLVGFMATIVQTLELRLVDELLESGELTAGVAAELRRHFTSRAQLGDLLGRSLPGLVRPLYAAGSAQPQGPCQVAALATGLECSYEPLLAHREAPWVEIEPVFDAALADCDDDHYTAILLPNLRDGYERSRAVDAARQLAIVALTVYGRGSLDSVDQMIERISLAAVPNRYTGEAVEVEGAGKGTVILRYPAAELRAQEWTQSGLRDPPPFSYRLSRAAS